MGPPPDGLTQTAVGQPSRPKNRTAEEEKREKQQADLARAQRLLAEARGMVDAVVAVGVKAVGEAGQCTSCREPLLAMAGRFAKRGGCGCDASARRGPPRLLVAGDELRQQNNKTGCMIQGSRVSRRRCFGLAR